MKKIDNNSVTVGKNLLSNSPLGALVESFLATFESASTISAYSKDLAIFTFGLDLTQPQKRTLCPSELNFKDVVDFRTILEENKLSPSTINRRLGSLRSFIKWVNRHSHQCPIDHKMIVIEKPKTTTDFEATRTELSSLGFKPDLETAKGLCHRLIMLLIYNLGLNRSEVVLIKISDLADKGVWVTGRKGVRRLAKLDDETSLCIEMYRKKVHLSSGDFLIQTDPSHRNTIPMDPSTVYRIIQRYTSSSGSNLSPRRLRASAINSRFVAGNKAEEVLKFAGLKNTNSTTAYRKANLNSISELSL